MATKTLAAASTRRERWAWYLYDFGNSAYASAVYLAVYSVYFKDRWSVVPRAPVCGA
jgi:MFS-type transporter involved in bile tolerance (Atg22 family)